MKINKINPRAQVKELQLKEQAVESYIFGLLRYTTVCGMKT